jgi:UDP-glucuronosyl/UDP-glucosyltransferase
LKKILFACWPAFGHVNPMLDIAIHIDSFKEYDVAFYTGNFYKEKIESKGICFWGFKNQMDFAAEKLQDYFPEYFKIQNSFKRFQWGINNIIAPTMKGMFLDLEEIYHQYEFDLLIVDPTFTGVVPFKKQHPDIPVICVGILPMQISSKDAPPYGLGLSATGTIWSKCRNRILSFVVQNYLFRKEQRTFNSILEEMKLSRLDYFYLEEVQRISNFYLQCTIPEFEFFRSDLPSNTKFIGPLKKLGTANNNKLADYILKKLTNGRPNILVTQGTLANQDFNELIIPSIWGLQDEDVNIFVLTGREANDLKEAFRTYDNIIVEEFIPFDLILPNIDIVITNSGYGGVQSAIFNACCIIACGSSEDKPEVGARVEYSNIGVNLSNKKITPSLIKKSYRKILKEKKYKSKVRDLSYKMQQTDALEEIRMLIEKI